MVIAGRSWFLDMCEQAILRTIAMQKVITLNIRRDLKEIVMR